MATFNTSSEAWNTLHAFDCNKEISMRVLSKGKFNYIDVRKFFKNKQTRFGVCLNLHDAIDLYNKLQNAKKNSEFISLSKASLKILNGTAFIAKGENKLFLDREGWKNFRKLLYIGLQMILLPDKDEKEQVDFAKRLMAAWLERHFNKISSKLFSFYTESDKDKFEKVKETVTSNPIGAVGGFGMVARQFGISQSLIANMVTSEWLGNFILNDLYDIYAQEDYDESSVSTFVRENLVQKA